MAHPTSSVLSLLCCLHLEMGALSCSASCSRHLTCCHASPPRWTLLSPELEAQVSFCSVDGLDHLQMLQQPKSDKDMKLCYCEAVC